MTIDEPSSFVTLTSIGTGVLAAVGFLWRHICFVDARAEILVNALKKQHEIVHQELWNAINENNKLIHEKTAEGDRRFATRDEVLKILEHMDRSADATNTRLDQLIQTLLNGKK